MHLDSGPRFWPWIPALDSHCRLSALVLRGSEQRHFPHLKSRMRAEVHASIKHELEHNSIDLPGLAKSC